MIKSNSKRTIFNLVSASLPKLARISQTLLCVMPPFQVSNTITSHPSSLQKYQRQKHICVKLQQFPPSTMYHMQLGNVCKKGIVICGCGANPEGNLVLQSVTSDTTLDTTSDTTLVNGLTLMHACNNLSSSAGKD